MSPRISFTCKTYNELTLNELYDLLALRQMVFSVEQYCAYLDADGNDQHSHHVFGQNETGQIIAYARLLPMGVAYDDYPSIGRVVTHPDYRNNRLGHRLMQESIKHCRSLFGGASLVKISAQAHLVPFYEAHGFRVFQEPYLEDGIPHVAMTYRLEK